MASRPRSPAARSMASTTPTAGQGALDPRVWNIEAAIAGVSDGMIATVMPALGTGVVLPDGRLAIDFAPEVEVLPCPRGEPARW